MWFNCSFWTCIQVSQETGKVVWYSHLFKYFPQFVVIHTVKPLQYSCLENDGQRSLLGYSPWGCKESGRTKQLNDTVKGFSTGNEAEANVFSGILLLSLWSNKCWQFNLWFAAFLKSGLYIWKFSVHILLKSSLKDLASMWNELKCMVVWAFFGIALLWDWNQIDYTLCIWRWKNSINHRKSAKDHRKVEKFNGEKMLPHIRKTIIPEGNHLRGTLARVCFVLEILPVL